MNSRSSSAGLGSIVRGNRNVDLLLLVQLHFGGKGLATDSHRDRCQVEVCSVEHEAIDGFDDIDLDRF